MNPNKVLTHPGQPQMQVEVILASFDATNNAPPIYTVRMRYPRIIHGEIMTHRMFSRNARSSRAVPVATMLNEVRNTPFVPWHWGKNQKGMQAGDECNEIVQIPDWDDINLAGEPKLLNYNREEAWFHARNKAVDVAEALMTAGYHKQIPNRLLEPFSWMDTLITTTNWSNFLWLRDHGAAEDHLQDLAQLVDQAVSASKLQSLEPGQWHLPYITNEDVKQACQLFDASPTRKAEMVQAWLCKLSAARCARISYKPFDGDASYERELERYDSLVKADRVHASPLEHQATPDVYNTGNELTQFPPDPGWAQPHLAGNLKGWIQNRKLISGEFHGE